MVGGDEQTYLPRRPPPQRWWVVILKAVSLSLLMFPSSTGGKWQFFEPETRPLPTALAPDGEGGGEGEVWTAGRPRATRYCAAHVCLAQRVLCVWCVRSVWCVGSVVCRGVWGV